MLRRLALIACLLAAPLVAASPAATSRQPMLRLTERSPVALAGTHFKPRERVRITVYASTKLVRALRASPAGAFIARFGDLYVGRCASLRAVAVGLSGSSAQLKLLPLPACISQ
jgi:hypothetical protein